MDAGREAKKKKKNGSNAPTDTLAAHISCGTYPHFRDSHRVIEFLCNVSVFFMHAVKGLFLHRLCARIRKKKGARMWVAPDIRISTCRQYNPRLVIV